MASSPAVPRMLPTMQDRLVAPVLRASGPVRVPALVRRIPAGFRGVGVRPEHMK